MNTDVIVMDELPGADLTAIRHGIMPLGYNAADKYLGPRSATRLMQCAGLAQSADLDENMRIRLRKAEEFESLHRLMRILETETYISMMKQMQQMNRLRVYRIDYAGAIHHVISSRMVGVGVHLDHAGMMPESVADAEIEELQDDKELTRIDDITGEPVVKTCRQWIDDEGPGLLMTSEW